MHIKAGFGYTWNNGNSFDRAGADTPCMADDEFKPRNAANRYVRIASGTGTRRVEVPKNGVAE